MMPTGLCPARTWRGCWSRRALSPRRSPRGVRRPARLIGWTRDDRASLSAARVYLRPVSVFLHLSTRRAGPAEAPALVSLGARLDDYLDEVAARPKGCPVPR